MAKLPQYQQQIMPQIATQGAAPAKNVRAMQEGMQGLASGLTTLRKIEIQQQEREARDYALNAESQTAIQLEKDKIELSKTAVTGSDYIDGLNDSFEKLKQAAIDNAPSEVARTKINDYYTRLKASESKQALQVSAGINAKNSAVAVSENLKVSVNMTLRNPQNYEQNLESGTSTIMESDLPESKKPEAVKAYTNELSYYEAKGAIKQNPSKALSDLEGGNYDTRLDPNQIVSLTAEAKAANQSTRSSLNAKIKSQVQDYVAYKNNGGKDVVDFTEEQLTSAYGENAPQVKAEIDDANEFSIVYGQVEGASATDLKSIAESQGDGPEDYRREAKQTQVIAKAIDKRNTDLVADPAKYSLKTDNVLTAYDQYKADGDGVNFAVTTIAEQNRLGIPPGYESILPKQEAAGDSGQVQRRDRRCGYVYFRAKKHLW